MTQFAHAGCLPARPDPRRPGARPGMASLASRARRAISHIPGPSATRASAFDTDWLQRDLGGCCHGSSRVHHDPWRSPGAPSRATGMLAGLISQAYVVDTPTTAEGRRVYARFRSSSPAPDL